MILLVTSSHVIRQKSWVHVNSSLRSWGVVLKNDEASEIPWSSPDVGSVYRKVRILDLAGEDNPVVADARRPEPDQRTLAEPVVTLSFGVIMMTCRPGSFPEWLPAEASTVES